MTQHWDAYWQQTRTLNSFGEGEMALGYTGELLQLWQKFFSDLPVNAHIVDIGTGNGAIPVAARQYSNKKQLNFQIHGIDSANVNPVKVFADNRELAELLVSIDFIPRCKVESMPFANESVDLLTSQFALEYAERNAALNECMRVLKPGGRLVAIMHHSESEVAIDSAIGLKVLSGFLNETPFFVQVGILFELLAKQYSQLGTADIGKQLAVANQQLLETCQQIKHGLPATSLHWFNDVMAEVAKLIVNFHPDNRQRLTTLKQGLGSTYLRLADQTKAAMTVDKAASLGEYLERLQCVYQLSEVNIDNKIFGWLLDIKK